MNSFNKQWIIALARVLGVSAIIAGWLLMNPASADGADNINIINSVAAYRDSNVELAKDYLIPRYRAFAAAAGAQREVLERFCANPDNAGLEAVRAAFNASTDAWMAVQHIRFGPVTLAFRAERVFYWPEQRNAVAKALNTLLGAQDRSQLEPRRFAQGTVAVQGLPALERLLFEGADPLAAFTDAATGSFRCALALAIGRNLATIGSEIVAEWQDPQSGVLAALAAGGEHPIYFNDPKEATTRVLTDLMTLFQVVADQKLKAVLGDGPEQAKPKLAENWRSGRSARNLKLNIESAYALYGAASSAGFARFVSATADGAALDAKVRAGFEHALTAAQHLPDSLGEAAADPTRREVLEQALAAVKTVRDLVGAEVPKAADITLGFNSLDGD